MSLFKAIVNFIFCGLCEGEELDYPSSQRYPPLGQQQHQGYQSVQQGRPLQQQHQPPQRQQQPQGAYSPYVHSPQYTCATQHVCVTPYVHPRQDACLPQQQGRPQQQQQSRPNRENLNEHPQQKQERPQQQQQQQPRPNKENLSRKPLQERHDGNAIDQQDSHYKSLRSQAHTERDVMTRCFHESREAFRRREGAKAKELSNEGKMHKGNMERLNEEASTWIFQENNQRLHPDMLDLHGLHVKEAIQKTEKAIVEARSRGDSQVRIIVGKGLHSQGFEPKVKPAIEKLMSRHRLVAELDPRNAGVLVVTLNKLQRR